MVHGGFLSALVLLEESEMTNVQFALHLGRPLLLSAIEGRDLLTI
jgi:hypothetical protein